MLVALLQTYKKEIYLRWFAGISTEIVSWWMKNWECVVNVGVTKSSEQALYTSERVTSNLHILTGFASTWLWQWKTIKYRNWFSRDWIMVFTPSEIMGRSLLWTLGTYSILCRKSWVFSRYSGFLLREMLIKIGRKDCSYTQHENPFIPGYHSVIRELIWSVTNPKTEKSFAADHTVTITPSMSSKAPLWAFLSWKEKQHLVYAWNISRNAWRWANFAQYLRDCSNNVKLQVSNFFDSFSSPTF